MSINYSIYTLDQLQDELDVLDPLRHHEEIAAIKSEISKKILQQPPFVEPSNNVLVMGTGFLYLGKYDHREDGTYMSIRFFVLLLLPIFPLASARIYSQSGSLKNNAWLRVGDLMVESAPLNWAEAKKVYLSFYAGVLLVSAAIWLFLLSDTLFNVNHW